MFFVELPMMSDNSTIRQKLKILPIDFNSKRCIINNERKRGKVMEKRMLFVYNPFSGKAHIKTYLDDIITIFTRGGYCVTVHPTSRVKDGYEYIGSFGKEYDVVSVCGGDGMLNEAVSALMELPRDNRPPLAYLPSGSTNDFAGTVGLPLDLRRAAKMIVEGKPFFCDGGKLNDKCFAYVAAFGAFTSVAYDTSQDFKNVFGHVAYIMEGIRQLPNIKTQHVKITFDGKTIEGDFLFGMVTNSLQVGGIRNFSGTAISLNDGLFEVLLVKKAQNAIEFQSMLSAVITQKLNNDNIIRVKASEITFESDEPISWTVDGEFGGDIKKAEVRNIPRAFSVIV